MKHTSGPWFSNDFQILSREKVIANMTYGERNSNNEADSCLIAAAPEMLSALRRAVLALAFASESSKSMKDDYEAVSNAIAKATGAPI
jgi:hypothetical protein